MSAYNTTEDTDLPDLMQVDNDSDDEGSEDGHDDSPLELEVAGLGEIHAPAATRSKRVRNAHTVSRVLNHPAVAYLLSV
jgi:hypothetical protein